MEFECRNISVLWFYWDFPIPLRGVQNGEDFGASEWFDTLVHSWDALRVLNREFMKFPVVNAYLEWALPYRDEEKGKVQTDWAGLISPAAICLLISNRSNYHVFGHPWYGADLSCLVPCIRSIGREVTLVSSSWPYHVDSCFLTSAAWLCGISCPLTVERPPLWSVLLLFAKKFFLVLLQGAVYDTRRFDVTRPFPV